MTTILTTLIKKASRGSLSHFTPNAPKQYGQPLPSPANVTGLITPERMREVVQRTPTASACINSILDYSVNVPLLTRHTNHAKKANPYKVDFVSDFLKNPNNQDTSKHFYTKLTRDLITLGYAAVEVERGPSGKPANLWVLDSARIRIDYDEHGTIKGYNMCDARGMPIIGADGAHAWKPEDIIFFSMNPISSSIYPTSRISQLFSLAILEDLMLHFISQRFTDSNTPFGIFDLGDISESELEYAKNQWNSQAQSGHKIMLTGSKGGSKWFGFGYHLKDLEAKELLNQIREKIMSILGVTMNELGSGENVNKANGFNLSYTFKKRAIEPLLLEISSTLTKRLLWDELGFKNLELYYEEIDSRDELLQSQIDSQNIKSGIYSINFVRNKKGLPSISGGDVPLLAAGSNWIPVDLVEDLAKAQLAALEIVDDALKVQQEQGEIPVAAPQTRAPNIPIKNNTPGAIGGGAARVIYPNPTTKQRKPPGNTPQKPRGATQTLRNQGMRKEDS